jgi:hypothetical protein
MARFSEHDRTAIDAIVDRWREDCLLHDGSLLFSRPSWSENPAVASGRVRRFDPDRVARFDRPRVERLLADPRIVGNRLKVESTVNNAVRVREVRREFGSFDAYLWQFVGDAPVQDGRRGLRDLSAETPLSRELSRDLRRAAFASSGRRSATRSCRQWDS